MAQTVHRVRRRPRRVAGVVAASLALALGVPGPAGAAQPPADPHANGTPVTLSGTDDPASGRYDFTGNSVYGGGNNLTPALTSTDLSVDATARSHLNIYGGNQAGPLDGPSRLTYDGARPDLTSTATSGYQAYFLYGAGESGTTTGPSTVTMNDGWVRGWVIGGGKGPVVGDTTVTMNGGLIGPHLNSGETVGQAEIYGGGFGADGTVQGNTYVTVQGPVYDPATYEPGQRATLVRQHVLGGGSSGAVVTGDTHVAVKGGTIQGMVLGGPGGGGLANNVVGDTYVEVSGGIITTQAGSTAGGSVFGGGYARNQNVTGNTHVRIVDGANISGGVYGGGYAGPLSIQGNVVTGNADTLIEGGKIGTNIYAGAAGLSRVNGTATVTLKDIAPGDPFATDFTRQILRGGIGTGGTAHTVFDHQTAPFLGTVGTANNGQMDSIRFVDDTRMDVDPARFHGRDWLIENGSTVDVVAAGPMSSRTFTNAGLLRLDGPDAPENLLSTIGGNYVSEGGTLAMGATSDEAKNFLEIQQAATLGDDGPTTIDLDLSPDWDGDRIDLVRSAAASDAGAFTMTPIPVDNGSFRGTAVLKSEPNEAGGLTWYIEGVPEELYRVVVNNGTLPGGLSTDTFYAGDTVELTADEPAEGMRFTGWRIDSGGPLEGIDLSSPSTTFTMPANDVEVTALYEPVPSPSPTPSPTHPTHSPSHGPGLPETGSSSLTPIALTVGLLALGGLLFLLRRGLKEGRH
ncbi:InlB B-repeat-containing protein [Streptomyces albidoflavus]|uniref:InlB B-repeat-containing protein n=1 Tax=Streptomyces albidoflavus TaxID=1886 RepID=UPI0033E0CA1D